MRTNRRLRLAAGVSILGVALAAALWLPIPTLPDAGRAALIRELDERLPGWQVERLNPSWEGAYSVVARCAGHKLAFQLVPGHGLAPQDAWLQPSNAYTLERLRDVSDHWRYLIWFEQPPRRLSPLSCSDDLVRRPFPTVD